MHHLLLAQAVSLAGLIAAVGEYAAIIRRRDAARLEYRVATIAGLQGLVRLEAFAEPKPRSRRWIGVARVYRQYRRSRG
jgi:hypothetical protein